MGVEPARFWRLTLWEFETMIAGKVAQVPPLKSVGDLGDHLMQLANRNRKR